MLERLRGKVGRTKLLAHITEHPRHNGGPTYRRNGRKLLFTEAGYARLLESFVPAQRESRLAIAAAPSNEVPLVAWPRWLRSSRSAIEMHER